MLTKCYEVTLKDTNDNLYTVGICTNCDSNHAMKSAEKTLLEGKHISAEAIEIKEVEAI